jgi:hypothetical protein
MTLTEKMFLYIPNLLTLYEHNLLCKELSEQQFKDENNHMAPGRLRTFMNEGTFTHTIFTSRQILEYLSHIFETELKPCPIPIEYRKYPIGGGMKWHRDVNLFDRQYECVYTVTNTSDSFTMHKDVFGKIHETWTEPNSLVIVQAEGVMHGVSPVTQGERTIIKFAVCRKNISLY